MSAQFILREAATNLRRHALAAFASMTTIALCLFILGASVFFSLSLRQFSERLVERSSMIRVYLVSSLPRSQSLALKAKIDALPGIARSDFLTKDAVWSQEKDKYKDFPDLNSLANPMGDEIHLTVEDPNRMDSLAARIRAYPGVEEARVGFATEMKRLLQLGAAARIFGIAASGLLLVASAFIIGNAIRLGIYSRRREIRIMQLVGAEDGFIQTPFLLEGMVHGFVGGLIAIVALTLCIGGLSRFIARSLPFLPFSISGYPILGVYLALTAIGVILGLLSSFVSVRRHLRNRMESP